MRLMGYILGGIYFADGLVALAGGKRAIKWTESTLGDKLPKKWNKTLHQMEKADNRIFSAWGINNILAGTGMVLISALIGRR